MDPAALFILCISSISLLGSSTFIYLYYKHPFIHRAFGMNYLLLIQFADFAFSFTNIIGSLPIVFDPIYCYFFYFFVHFFTCLQSVLISYYFIFLYQVIYMRKERSEVKMKRFFLLLIFILLIEPVYYTTNSRFVCEKHYCIKSSIKSSYFISLDLLLSIVCSNLAWCMFATIKMFKKFKTHFSGTDIHVKWTIFRLLIFPIINWVCTLPAVLFSHYTISQGSQMKLVESILYANNCANGVYDFIALICTKEFRDAMRIQSIHNKGVRSEIISLV